MMGGNAERRYGKPVHLNINVSIIIPTLNEEKNVASVLEKIVRDERYKEIIVVDGGSSDRTVDVCKRYTDRVFTQTGNGKGNAIREAVNRCVGKYVLVIDGDGSHNADEINLFIDAFSADADLVKGSRFMRKGYTHDMETVRKIGNFIFLTLTNIFFRSSFSDICYGFIGFRKNVFHNLRTRENGFAIDTEIVIRSKKKGYKIVEVPSIEYPRNTGKSYLQVLPDGFRILRVILREAVRNSL